MSTKGSILITTLWVMTIFSIMTASLAFAASQHVMMMKREIQDFQDKADFTSVFWAICSKINMDAYAHEDSVNDAWYGKVTLSEEFANRISAMVSDEESKINLNDASERLFGTIFKNLESEGVQMKGGWKNYIKTIIKFRSENKIRSMEELLLMDDFEAEDYETMQTFFTVYPDVPLININTASPLIIKSLIESIPGEQSTKLLLIGRLTELCSNNQTPSQCNLLSRELNPEFFMDRLHLPKSSSMTIFVQEFLSKVTTDSETFRLIMTTKSKKEAETVFRFRSGQLRPEVYSWHEI